MNFILQFERLSERARAGGNERDGNGSNSEQRLLEYFFKSNERKFGDFHHEIYFSTNTLKIVGFMI